MKLLLENWREFIREEYEPITTLRIFDFDETIAHTRSETRVKAPDGSKATLTNQKQFDEYMRTAAAKEGIQSFDPVRDLQELGYDIDLSDFLMVKQPEEIQIVTDILKQFPKDSKTYILTARRGGAIGPIIDYLEEIGIDFLEDPESIKILKNAGCDIKGERVHIPKGLARKYCSKAPEQFVQFARNKNILAVELMEYLLINAEAANNSVSRIYRKDLHKLFLDTYSDIYFKYYGIIIVSLQLIISSLVVGICLYHVDYIGPAFFEMLKEIVSGISNWDNFLGSFKKVGYFVFLIIALLPVCYVNAVMLLAGIQGKTKSYTQLHGDFIKICDFVRNFF